MKTLLKLLAVAAAFGMAPAAVAQQATTTPAAAQPAAAPPGDAVSAPSQAAPAPAADATAAPAAAAAKAPAYVLPKPDYIGQPDHDIHIQNQVTPIGREAAWFHNVLLVPIIVIISIFVLILMIYVVIRFRRAAHPVPSRTTHNTALEVIWTLVPVLILVAIAIPSIQLLANQYSPPKADVTVKVTGNQWYWTYSYPDNGDFEIVSNMLSDEDAKKRGEPRLLGVDERMVVPVGATVKLIITASDVIHSWGVPAFWVKLDAVPGRLNETWFKAEKPGLYYGQCFELCGARHAYMPIAVEVVSQEQFAAWVASKGGTMPGAVTPAAADATANSPITNAGAAAGSPTPTAGGSATETSPEPTNISAGTATPPVTSQGATDSAGKQ